MVAERLLAGDVGPNKTVRHYSEKKYEEVLLRRAFLMTAIGNVMPRSENMHGVADALFF